MYTSDMSDSQWEIVKEILKEEKYRYVTEKREQVNAVFYLVKTGCQWRNWQCHNRVEKIKSMWYNKIKKRDEKSWQQ